MDCLLLNFRYTSQVRQKPFHAEAKKRISSTSATHLPRTKKDETTKTVPTKALVNLSSGGIFEIRPNIQPSLLSVNPSKANFYIVVKWLKKSRFLMRIKNSYS